MKKILFVASLLAVSGGVGAADSSHWGYSGHEGPEYWGELAEDYSTCTSGKNQSPINLQNMIESDLEPINIQYQVGGNQIINNGHTIQVNYSPGSNISLDGYKFELKQFHFHVPSENHIDGKAYPMEAHFVHADTKGNLAVIAVMIEEGEANESMSKAWATMPEEEGDKYNLSPSVSAEGLLPANRDYYRFNGSLTTPPCSEGVWWLVMKDSVTATKAQIGEFSQAMKHPNNRPIQPLNARSTLK